MANFLLCLLTANTASFSAVVDSVLLPMEYLYQELVSHLCWIQFFNVSI